MLNATFFSDNFFFQNRSMNSDSFLYVIVCGAAIGACIGAGIGYVVNKMRNKRALKEYYQQKKAAVKQAKTLKKVTKAPEVFPDDINEFNMPIDPNETIRFIDSSSNTWEEHKMMIAVRTDVQMNKAKTAAHCGHATLGAYKIASKYTPNAVKLWYRLGQAKITLKINGEEDLYALANQAKNAGIPFYVARNSNASTPNIPEGTPTILAIGPVSKSRVGPITGKLKLLS